MDKNCLWTAALAFLQFNHPGLVERVHLRRGSELDLGRVATMAEKIATYSGWEAEESNERGTRIRSSDRGRHHSLLNGQLRAARCPSGRGAGWMLLSSDESRTVIALWLGHESIDTTQMYLDADLRLKEKALERTTPLGLRHRHYRPDDELMAFLKAL